MEMKRRALSLSEELNQIINPEPIFKDPEDDINIESSAHNVVKDQFDIQDNDIQLNVTKLRRKSAPNLSDIDFRYAGKKINRKKLHDDDDDDDQEYDSESDEDVLSHDKSDEEMSDDEDEGEDEGEEDDDDDEDEDEGEEDDDEDVEFYNDNLNAPRAVLDEYNSASSQNSISSENYSEEDSKQQINIVNEKDNEANEDNDYIRQFSNIDVQDEISKGQAVKNQLAIWDNFMECIIKVHKLLIDSNKCPQYDVFDGLKSTDNSELNNSVINTSDKLKDLLNTFLKIDCSLQAQNKSLFSPEKQDSDKTEENEEILSDSDHSVDEEHQHNEEEMNEVSKSDDISKFKRKLTDSEYETILAKRHKSLIPIRNETIDKWYEKTRFSGGKFSQKTLNSLEQSATKQIQHIMTNTDRLIKRTQMKRSNYDIIGKKHSENINTSEEKQEKNEENYDNEIFDDDDFYHQLLRELIERKTTDSTDPIALSRKWIEIQKIRNKMKRKVDTKASKGRRVRYDIHPKLVNFMAPVDDSTFTDAAKDELFNSLFGKTNVESS